MMVSTRGVTFSAPCLFILSILISVGHSCPRGYYGSPCKACPTSTYKDYSGAAGSCKSCPANSGHQLVGSTSRNDCQCIKGYEGRPELGYSCVIRSCVRLLPPRDGVIVGSCNNKYLSVCRMECTEGYEAVGTVERRCVENKGYMTWTGTPMYCRVIVCPVLHVSNADIPYGKCSDSTLVYKTRCVFTCRSGYQLKGSKERVCQLDKSWSGSSTSCETIYCPKLPSVQAARVYPPECVTGPVKAGTYCSYVCASGYVMDKASSDVSRGLECRSDRTWSGKVPQCHDISPPTLICPHDLTTRTSKRKATRKVLWSVEVTDNSVSIEPNAKVTLNSSHVPLQELPIGSHDINVKATDNAGNFRTCTFSIEVRDTEPPTCSFCPGDIAREETTREVRVNWKSPTCSDNSGIPPSIESNRQNGARFIVPGFYEIQYVVRDQAGNANKNCSFRITLKVKSCPRFPPPRNGALACVTLRGDLQCAVLCRTGTDFEFNPPLNYLCGSGQWQYFGFGPYVAKTPWPNCSAKANPSWIRMVNLPYFFYSGDAHYPNVQEAIKDKYHSFLTKSQLFPPRLCSMHPDCTKQRISVFPGEIG